MTNVNLNTLMEVINNLPYVNEPCVRRDIEEIVKFLTFDEVVQKLDFDITLIDCNGSLCSHRNYLRIDGGNCNVA